MPPSELAQSNMRSEANIEVRYIILSKHQYLFKRHSLVLCHRVLGKARDFMNHEFMADTVLKEL